MSGAWPADWTSAEVARPPLTSATDARITQWEARSPTGGATTEVRACVATPIPGWVEDMRPAIEARTVAFAGATAERVVGAQMDAREEKDVFLLRRASDLGGPVVGTARTFLGFDEGHVFTCVAVCASPAEATRACDATVAAARLEGSSPPPAPGIGLGAITWAVHHPRSVAAAAAGFIVLMAILALWRRRRPRLRAR